MEKDGEILGGCVFLEDKDIILYWIGCNKRSHMGRDKRTLIGNGSHLLLWDAINYAKKKGIKELDLGGLFAEDNQKKTENSIDKFKESFGGNRVYKYNYSKDYNNFYVLLRRIYIYINNV